MGPLAVPVVARHGPHQSVMQAHPVNHPGRHVRALGVLGGMAGVFGLVAIDCPHWKVLEFLKGTEPITWREFALKMVITDISATSAITLNRRED